MSFLSIASLILLVCSIIMYLVLRTLQSDLKSIQRELAEAKLEIVSKTNELEAINEIQNKIITSRKRKVPEKVPSAAGGDSTSRLDRLNSVSDKSTGDT